MQRLSPLKAAPASNPNSQTFGYRWRLRLHPLKRNCVPCTPPQTIDSADSKNWHTSSWQNQLLVNQPLESWQFAVKRIAKTEQAWRLHTPPSSASTLYKVRLVSSCSLATRCTSLLLS